MSEPLTQAQRAIVGWGVAERLAAPVVLDELESSRLRQWADRTQLVAPTWAAFEAGAVVLTEIEAGHLRDTHLREQHRTLLCEAAAAELSDLLAGHGIETRALKGLASARLDHPDPALRTFSDVDLLVRRVDLPGALGVLKHAGHRMVEATPARWWLHRYGRAVTLRGPVGVEVDLHAAIVVGYFGVRLDHDRLFDLGPDEIELGGTTVRALPLPARLLASAYAAVLSRGRHERLWRDLAAQVLGGSEDDWRAAVTLAGEAGGEGVLARAVAGMVAATGASAHHPIVDWAATVQPSERAAQALTWADAGETQGWRADARSTLLALPPWDRALFLAGAGVHRVARRLRKPVER